MTVVSLGAWCDVVTDDEFRDQMTNLVGVPVEGVDEAAGVPATVVEEAMGQFRRGLSFRVHEFATLADGRRITLHEERGFGISAGAADLWSTMTSERLEQDVRTTVLPDEDDTADEHPYDWLAELLRAHGVDASPGQLRRLPYDVEFSERVQTRLIASP